MHSDSPLRHLPSLPVIYTPSDIRRSDTITPTGRRPNENDNDITPRPLRIKKVKKSPSMPFRKKGRGGQEGKEKDRESKRGFLRRSFPPSPRARSSSAGVLGKDRDKGNPDRDEDFNDAWNLPGGRGSGSNPNGARMAWLQRPGGRQMTSVSGHGNETDPHRRKSSVLMEPNNPEGHESHDSSSHTAGDVCLLPYSDDQSTGDRNRKNTFLRRAASTSAKYDKSVRRRLEQRRLGTVDWVLEETAPAKSPPRGWRQIAMDLFQGNNYNPGQAAVKRANSRKRERSDSISSTKSVLTYATPPEVPLIESDAAGDARKQVGGSHPENFAAGDMWQLGGQDGSRHVSRDGRSIPPPGRVRSANVLATIDSNISGKNRTRPQKCGQWKPPMLILDLAITPERDTLPIHSSQSREQNGFWISVEIEGKISSGSGYAGQSQGVGLDIGVLMDLS